MKVSSVHTTLSDFGWNAKMMTMDTPPRFQYVRLWMEGHQVMMSSRRGNLGLREQIEQSNTMEYSVLTIKDLEDIIRTMA